MVRKGFAPKVKARPRVAQGGPSNDVKRPKLSASDANQLQPSVHDKPRAQEVSQQMNETDVPKVTVTANNASEPQKLHAEKSTPQPPAVSQTTKPPDVVVQQTNQANAKPEQVQPNSDSQQKKRKGFAPSAGSAKRRPKQPSKPIKGRLSKPSNLEQATAAKPLPSAPQTQKDSSSSSTSVKAPSEFAASLQNTHHVQPPPPLSVSANTTTDSQSQVLPAHPKSSKVRVSEGPTFTTNTSFLSSAQPQAPTVPPTIDVSSSKAIRRRKAKQRPDPAQMTMKDLIHFNPKSKVQKKKGKGKASASKDSTDKIKSGRTIENESLIDSVIKAKKDEFERPTGPAPVGPASQEMTGGPKEEKNVHAPRVVFDEITGELVVDKSSLEQQSFIPPPDDTVTFTESSGKRMSYGKKKTQSKKWTAEETELFYKGLRAFGMDFDTIRKILLPDRSHLMIKKKFNREDKANKSNIDEALKPSNRILLNTKGVEVT